MTPPNRTDSHLRKLSFLPNALTVARVALVPVLILMLTERRYGAALFVFFIAGVSDGLDGFLAKRFNWRTRLGAILDPLADKILLVGAFVMLTILGHIPFWLLLAVFFRDLLIVGGYLAYTSMIGAVNMRPSHLSKLNTVVQILLVLSILLEQARLLVLPGLTEALILLALATTLASAIHYFWIWAVLRQIEPADAQPRDER